VTRPGLPSDWTRLHKLSPLLRSSRALVALFTVLGSRQLSPGADDDAWLDVLILGLAALAATVSWLVTRWRIHNGELQIETGLIRRQSLRVPLTRLQAVDVVRPLLARMLGLAEVRLVVAGRGSAHTRLAYLTEERAAEVRAQLLAIAHGLEADTPEPAERPVLAVGGGRIVASNLLAPGPLSFLVVIVGTVFLFTANPTVAAGLAGAALALGFALVLATAHQVGSEWEFTLGQAPDGLRLRAGLLQHRAETIPIARVQAIRRVEPLLWRLKRWVRLEVDVARQQDRDPVENESAASNRALLPVGAPEEADHLLTLVLPDAGVRPPANSLAPSRVRWRAPLLRHNLHAWYDETYVVCAGGRIRRTIVVVPLEKVQSIRWSQGPLSRRLGLASVHVDTAGRRFTGSARFRDAGEARSWMAELPDLARLRREHSSRAALPRGVRGSARARDAADVRTLRDDAGQ
jgi:putative membrane protein